MSVHFRLLITPSIQMGGDVKLSVDVLTVNDQLEVAKNEDGSLKIENHDECVIKLTAIQRGMGFVPGIQFETGQVSQDHFFIDGEGKRHFVQVANMAVVGAEGNDVGMKRDLKLGS